MSLTKLKHGSASSGISEVTLHVQRFGVPERFSGAPFSGQAANSITAYTCADIIPSLHDLPLQNVKGVHQPKI